MNDSKKNLTEEELKLIEEEELFMKEVYSDPEVANAQPPADLHDKVFAEIRAREAAKKVAQLTDEKRLAEEREEQRKDKDLEFIKLEKRYKRAIRMEKWVILAAVLIMALAFGVTAVGGPEKIFEKINWMIAGREQVNVDSEDGDMLPRTSTSEDETYQEIEDTFGFVPVRMNYLPEGVMFLEATVSEEIQNINLVYGKGEKVKVSYFIRPNYRVSSFGKDLEDEFMEEYVEQNEYTTIYIKKYLVEDGEERWSVQYEYSNVSYSLTIYDTHKEEVDNIVESLYFP